LIIPRGNLVASAYKTRGAGLRHNHSRRTALYRGAGSRRCSEGRLQHRLQRTDRVLGDDLQPARRADDRRLRHLAERTDHLRPRRHGVGHGAGGELPAADAQYRARSAGPQHRDLDRNIEIGLYAEKTGKTTQTYGPRWTELTNSGGRTKAITAGVNPTKADKRNHTYMTVRQDHGDQWDVLYDFNKVGATTSQLKAPRGNPNRIDVGLEVMGPQYTNVPDIANRMQFMTENKVWMRVATRNTAKVVSLPACSTAHTPPNCFKTKLTDNTSFTQWTVSKPRRAAASALPAPPVLPGLAAGVQEGDVFNGVDQQALQTCLEEDPDTCLDTVPGLAECVHSVRVCNAAALRAVPSPDASEQPAGMISADAVREQAAATFAVARADVDVTAPSSRQAVGTDGGQERAWTVSSAQTTPGLQRGDRLFGGFTARDSAQSGALLDACWGGSVHRLAFRTPGCRPAAASALIPTTHQGAPS